MLSLILALVAILFLARFFIDRTVPAGGRLRHVLHNLAADAGELTLATSPDDLKAQMSAIVAEVKAISEKAEAENRDFTTEERALVKAKIDDATKAKARREEMLGDQGLKDAIDAIGRGLIDSPGAHALADNGKSLGHRVITDESFGTWLKSAQARNLGEKSRIGESPAAVFRGLKDITAGGDVTSAGALIAPDFRGLLDGLGQFQRPLTIRNVVSSGTATTDMVSYARVTGFTNNAAPVPEARGTSAGDASADVPGTKPESDLELEVVNEPVKTIAHWLPATKRALSDAAQIRTLIDTFLMYGLEEELEDQMVNGNGSGENFEGILAVDGVQTLDETSPALTGSIEDATGSLAAIVALRVAKRLVRVNGRATANAYVLNPADNERIDLARDGNGQFYFGGPGGNGVSTAWGLPRIESEAVAEGTALCADFRQAMLWDREQAAISVSDSHADFFVRNLIAILAELRAAFGVIRPPAFVQIDLDAIFDIS